MKQEKTISGTFTKSARVISDYANDMIFEQPREGLIAQEFTTYENIDNGVKKTVITRTFATTGEYNDVSAISILPNSI